MINQSKENLFFAKNEGGQFDKGGNNLKLISKEFEGEIKGIKKGTKS